MFNMLIHCRALGNTPHIRNIHNSFAVNSTNPTKGIVGTPLTHIIDWTAECATNHGLIKNLLIACHGGYMATENCSTNGCLTGRQGGYGINLGTGINNKNVFLMGKLARKVSNIYLYVCCGALDTANPDIRLKGANESLHPNFLNNNRVTCSLMAAHTEANVYASASEQLYDHGGWYERIDFGTWEGKVEKFTPQGPIIDVTGRMTSFGNETGDE